MNYLCLVDGVVEYGTNDRAQFTHYQMMYAEDHREEEEWNLDSVMY